MKRRVHWTRNIGVVGQIYRVFPMVDDAYAAGQLGRGPESSTPSVAGSQNTSVERQMAHALSEFP